MIRKSEPLSIAESLKYMKESEAGSTDTLGFAKKFVKISSEDATSMREKIIGLELIKVRDVHIAKIIDMIPESSEELKKIFVDINLDEDEIKKILDIVSEFK